MDFPPPPPQKNSDPKQIFPDCFTTSENGNMLILQKEKKIMMPFSRKKLQINKYVYDYFSLHYIRYLFAKLHRSLVLCAVYSATSTLAI